MEAIDKRLIENEPDMPVKSLKTLYAEGELELLKAEDGLFFRYGSQTFRLASHPYEPCTYLLSGEKTAAVIHNAFTVEEIRRIAEEGGAISSVTGNKYDAGRLCRLLAFAASACPDADIGYLEGRIAINEMKAMGALSPETAVPLRVLGLKSISDRFSRSKRLTERVMYTEDGRVYVCIKPGR